MSYLADRFEAAVRALVGDGPIKKRLATAYAEYLEDVEDGELPAGLRATFEDLRRALHRVAPMGKETCVKASVQKMSFYEAGCHAATVVDLYAELVRHGERAEPLKVVSRPAESPPRYLASGS